MRGGLPGGALRPEIKILHGSVVVYFGRPVSNHLSHRAGPCLFLLQCYVAAGGLVAFSVWPRMEYRSQLYSDGPQRKRSTRPKPIGLCW